METIRGITAAAPPRPTAPRTAPGGATFAIPAEHAQGAAPAAGTDPAGLVGLLALQEAEGRGGSDHPPRDRAARRRGLAILEALARLQRAILAGGPDAAGAALAELAALSADPPDAADPALLSLLGMIVLRARVEAARHATVPPPA